MKIIDLKVRCVAIPTTCQLRHNTGVHPGYFLRTILELVTDEGIVGLGEVGGGDQRGALLKLKPRARLLGLDPFHLEILKLKVLRSIYYIECAPLRGDRDGVPRHSGQGPQSPTVRSVGWRRAQPDSADRLSLLAL